MRIKNFTLMLMAVLFSVAGFAQKSFTPRNDVAINRQTTIQKMVKQNGISAIAVNQPSTPSRSAKAPAKAPEVVTPPEKGDVEYYTLTGSATYGNNTTTDVSRQVKVVWDDEDEDVVYISGLSYYMPSSFVKGTFNKEGDKVIFASGQYMGNPGADIYFCAYNTKEGIIDAVAEFNEKESTFTFSDYLLDNGDPKEFGPYARFAPGVTIVPLEGDPEIPVEIPSDMEITTYAYTAFNYFGENNNHQEPVSGTLNIGFYGDDMYIQGISNDSPEAWIKGTFENDSIVAFAGGQLLEDGLYFNSLGEDFSDVYTLVYNAETGVFVEGDYAVAISDTKNDAPEGLYQFYYGYEIKPITEQAAVPGKSSVFSMNYRVTGEDVLEFALATVDVDNEGLVADKLAYKLWYVTAEGDTLAAKFTTSDYPALEEDLDEMPASFTDGAYIQSGALAIKMEGHATWKSLGIQCIYYGGEERNEGEIAWYTPAWPHAITLPEGLTVTEHNFIGTDGNSGTEIASVVGIAFSGDDMYIRGLGQGDKTAWVKGTKDASGDYIFPLGQDLGIYNGSSAAYRLFFLGYENRSVTSAKLTVDDANNQYVFSTALIENTDYTDYLNRSVFTYIASGATISMAEAVPEVPEVVTVPEGLETESWIFSGTDYFDSKQVARSVKVGFDGDDVYVQGLSSEVPAAWIKGTLEGDEVTFATGQFLGGADSLFFIGYNLNSGIVDYVMTYDEDAGRFYNDNPDLQLGVNAYKDKVQKSIYEFYNTTKIAKVVNRAATPATPSVTTLRYTNVGNVVEFNIPLIDTNSEGLVDSLVSYKLYYDEGDGEAKEVVFTTDLYEKIEEDMTVIPYGFTENWDFYASAVYLNMDDSAWKRIGIQTIYTGGDETNASEIGWYTPTRPFTVELPEGAETQYYVFTGTDGDGEFSRAVKIAKVDNDVYIQGVATVDSESWIKGTKSEDSDVYTFPKGQFLGVFTGQQSRFNIYLMGYNSTLGVLDVKMTYNAETDSYTTTNIIVENANYTDNRYSYNNIAAGAVIAPVEMDRAATPEVPAISTLRYYISKSNNFTSAMLDIPLVDVDGVPLADTLLTYKLYYDEGDSVAKLITFTTDLYQELEADMSEIPYGFIDDSDFFKDLVYLNMDMSTWKRIGIQAIYSGGGETNASEIGWYTPTWPTIAEPADEVETKIYDFFGSDLDGTSCAVGGLKVAMEGDKVYVQSMFENSQYWIVGTKGENNIYTFDLGQYLGNVLGDDGYPYSLFLTGYNTTSREAEALQMSYNEETGVFTTLNLMLSNSDYTDLVDYSAFSIFAPGAQLVPGDGPDAITSVEANAEENAVRFNIAGQRVGKNYKGLIVEKGRKLLQK